MPTIQMSTGEDQQAQDLALIETTPVRRVRPGDANYGPTLENASRFFRAQSAGRYTDRSIMQIARAADRYQNSQRSLTDWSGMPMVVQAEAPAEYDELTETKYGGLIGIALCWTEDGRTMVAVQRRYRRMGLGTRLMHKLMHDYVNVSAWVAQTNTTGQQFLLSVGLMPMAFNAANAIRYGRDTPEDEDAASSGF